jgi:hypothetical protein
MSLIDPVERLLINLEEEISPEYVFLYMSKENAVQQLGMTTARLLPPQSPLIAPKPTSRLTNQLQWDGLCQANEWLDAEQENKGDIHGTFTFVFSREQ